jgi:hypothetical protein
LPYLLVTTDPIKSIRLGVSAKVRAMMARHGVDDQRQQLATLMSIMDASYSQVYRKISGRSSWLEEDLHRISQFYGETLGTLFRDEADAPALQGSAHASWRAAKALVAGVLLDCQVTLSEQASVAGGLALVHTAEGLRVESAVQPSGAIEGLVSALRLDLARPLQGGYAVLDDDADVADSIVDNLLARGLDAQAFYSKEDLQASARRFDTYILDWYTSDSGTTGDLVVHLRTRHAPKATIVILTGQIQRDKAESELAKLIHTQDVMVELKPMRLDLLLAKIEHTRQA